MDKLFRNTWFIKIISFLIALMLFSMVTSEENKNNDGSSSSSGQDVETINENLSAQYDADKYIVLGLPSSVKVRLKGSTEEILKAKLQTTRKVYVDFTDKKPGKYNVKIQTEGFPSELSVEVIPSTVDVTIQKKVTQSFPVSLDLLNRANIAEGYSIGDYKVDPDKVSVTGAEKLVKQIAFVKGVVDLKDITKSVEQQVSLNAYDKNGNQLDVNIDPSVVKVEIPVESPSKEVPITVKPTGELSDGYAIESIDVTPETVKLFGGKDFLDGIAEVDGIEVPVDDLDKTKTIQVDVPLPKDAEKVEPDTIDVTVHVGKESTRVIQEIPIIINDLANKNRNISFINPENRSIKIKLTGAEKVLNQLQRTDIQAVIDISSLSAGDHEVPIQVTVPDFIDYTLTTSKAEIKIEEDQDTE